MYVKDFESWNKIKQKFSDKNLTSNIRSGEIRWISFGVNVGSEIDGKGEQFVRPALVVHRIGDKLALVIPMTTKIKELPGYYKFAFKDKNSCLCIHQVRVISTMRILNRMGKISARKLKLVRNELKSFYSL